MTIEDQERAGDRVEAPAVAGSRRPGVLVIAVVFICLTLSAGFGFYSLSTYARFLVERQGMSLTATSSGSTVYMLSSGLGGIVVARLLRRFDLRSVMLAGVVVSAATVPFIGLSHRPWQLWLVYLVYGLGGSGISMIPASMLVMRWYGEAPARAMALATTGMSVGGALLAPAVASWVAHLGLPRTGLLMAIVTLAVLAPLILLTVRPDGRDAPRSAAVPVGRPPPVRLGFAAIAVAFGLLMLSQVGAVTHLLTLSGERHIPHAATALSLLAGTSVVGRLAGIPVLARANLYHFCVCNALLQAAAMVVLGLAHARAGLFLGAVLLGATVGNTVVLMPLVILDAFGTDRYPAVFARTNLVTSFGVALAPLLLGVLHDDLGGYAVGLGCLGGGSALAAGVLAALSVAQRRRRGTIPAERPTAGS